MRALIRVGGKNRQGPGLISDKREYIAYENQAVFSITYAPGNIDVYRNGLRLHHTDFVAVDGETAVLLDKCAEGDIVALSGGGVSVVPGAYSRAESDAQLQGKADARHEHEMSDVSGLESALAGKAEKNATAALSGGLKARLDGTTLYLTNDGSDA